MTSVRFAASAPVIRPSWNFVSHSLSLLSVLERAMVQVKHQKQKSQKQDQVKKKQGGKQTDTTQFRAQLDALGLKIVHVTADGNCFFRALADQLEGNEEEHGKYRSMVVQFISKNREMFEPFIEDEVPFDEYCHNMENDGTWAGHMELQAASLVTRCNICIHRNMSPRWYIRNFDEPGVRMVHLSYHDGEHYNSVRLKEDTGVGPARSIVIKADSDLSSSSRQLKGGVNKSRGGASMNTVDSGSIKVVMAGSGCESKEKVEQILQEMAGDVDAAIEYLVAEQGSEDASLVGGSFSIHADACHGDNGGLISEQEKDEQIKETPRQDQPSSSVKRTRGNTVEDDKKIPRNKPCPCGSKKKYKSCCGSGTGRSSLTIINQAIEPTKGTKGKSQGRKGGPPSAMASGPGSEPPDMGALCI